MKLTVFPDTKQVCLRVREGRTAKALDIQGRKGLGYTLFPPGDYIKLVTKTPYSQFDSCDLQAVRNRLS